MSITRVNPAGDFDSVTGGEVSLASGTAKDLCTLELAAGTWVVIGSMACPSNTTGFRHLSINTTANTLTYARGTHATLGGVAGSIRMEVVSILRPASATTYHLVGYQNSGAAMTVTGAIQAVRIR